MKLKATVAGLIFAGTMIAAGSSQAYGMYERAYVLRGHCSVPGWHMVHRSAGYVAADTWQEYVSGGYLPPVTNGYYNRGPFFFW